MSFKYGDKVRRISGIDDGCMKKGTVYTVTGSYMAGGIMRLHFLECASTRNQWQENFFELVGSQTWMERRLDV